MARIYFLSPEQIKDNTAIDTNVRDKVLTNIQRTAEDIWLQEILGTPLYKLLKTNVETNSLTTKQKTLIDDYVLQYLYALIEMLAVDDLLIKLTDNGVNSPTPDASTQKTKQDLTAIKTHKVKAVNFYCGLIKDYIEKNISSFPEYNDYNEGVPAKRINNYGFFFDDNDYIDDNNYYKRKADNNYEESI